MTARALADSRLSPSSSSRAPFAVLLVAVTAAGAALRFFVLGRQGFWYDEAHTAYLVQLRPGKLLELLRLTESTPPLYYACAWVWARLFGSAEAGLRSLSALAGAATVPVMYLVGRDLASRRAGTIAAALAASSPLLVWYSQEARAYSLLVLLSACAFLLFVRALRHPGRAAFAGWAATSALALATHYLAVLVIAPAAAVLLQRHRRRAGAWLAVAAVAAAGGALLPLAIEQRATHHTDWIARIALEVRLRQLLAQFLAGFGASTPSVVLAAAGLAAGVLMLRWAGRRQRHAACLAGAIGVGGVILALLLTAVGLDELLTRNLIAVLPPLIAAVSIGLAQPRTTAIGLAAAVIACAGWTAVDLRVLRDPGLERPDWRAVLRVLGPARVTRLLVLEHYRPQLPLRLYDPAIRRVRGGQVVRAREVDVIAPRVPRGRSCWCGRGLQPEQRSASARAHRPASGWSGAPRCPTSASSGSQPCARSR